MDSDYVLDVKADIGLTDDDLAGQYQYTKDIVSVDGSQRGDVYKRQPQLIRMEERVLPADSKNFLYCRTAKWSGSFCSSRSNMRSTGL